MKHKEFTISFLRNLPTMVLCTLLVHVLLLCFGVETIGAEIIEVSLGFVAVWCMSKQLHYCMLHRIQILFAYFVTSCVWWQKYSIGFGPLRHKMHIIVLTVGMCILSAVIVSAYRGIKNKKKRNLHIRHKRQV